MEFRFCYKKEENIPEKEYRNGVRGFKNKYLKLIKKRVKKLIHYQEDYNNILIELILFDWF